jgi:hypothetical protein
MGLLDKLTSSILGLKGETPVNFGVDPLPPGSLHDEFSTTGKPNVKWRTISGNGPKPQPSRLDIGDSKDKYKPTSKYTG